MRPRHRPYGTGCGKRASCPQGEGPRPNVYPKRLRVVFPLVRSSFGRVVGVGSRPQFYIGDKKKNQAVNTNDIRKAAVLRLTSLLATTLTVGRVLVVARAANVAMITNAAVSTKKMTSIITRLPDFELRFVKYSHRMKSKARHNGRNG
jgi:hypothetical protein